MRGTSGIVRSKSRGARHANSLALYFFAAFVILTLAVVGLVSRGQNRWFFASNALTALMMLFTTFMIRKQRSRDIKLTLQKLDELLELLGSSRRELSSQELRSIEQELEQIRTELLRKLSFER